MQGSQELQRFLAIFALAAFPTAPKHPQEKGCGGVWQTEVSGFEP